MYRKMVGLDTYEDGVGYKHIKVQPHIGGGFTNATASLKTYYGTVSSGWKIQGNTTMLDVEIPANTTATVFIPAPNAAAITEGGNALPASIKVDGSENGYVMVNIGSGSYHFAVSK
jgi:alpha-L-rhamnosidase